MASHDTLFTNDSGAAAGPIAYVQDVFPDVSLSPSANTGLTSNANTNPFSMSFSNDDGTRYGVKTLYIKGFTLIADRSKWISNKPTYLINWTENFPQVVGYCFGAVNLNAKTGQNYIDFANAADGIGVNGVIRRAAWLIDSNTSATATSQNVVDGSNGTTNDFSKSSADSQAISSVKYRPYFHAASNETYDLHDIRMIALQGGNMSVIGVMVYFENSGKNIDQFPGSTYVNKSKVTSVQGATFALPALGSSLGGKSMVYKTASSGYAVDSISATTMTTLGSGTSGSALLNVTTGTGGSFLAGYGLAVTSGANGNTLYVGNVVSVSTDTLTMNPVLPYNITNANVYRSWYNSASASINASLMQLAYQIDFSSVNRTGLSGGIMDPQGGYAFWGSNIGLTQINGLAAAAFSSGGVGFMQVDGSFGAAEIEIIGNGIFHATLSVNGVPGASVNVGQTGPLRRTIFAEGGPGWNSFAIQPGVSLGLVGISKVNLYQRRRDIGVTFGALSEFETLQSYGDRGTINSTMMSLGLHRRIYADQMSLGGSFARGQTTGAAGGVIYYGTATSAVYTQTYYGKNFAIIGTAGGGTLALDGAGIGLTFNAMQSVATEGFHTVTYASGTGATSVLQAFDYVRSTGEFRNLQTVGVTLGPSAAPAKSVIWLQFPNGYGSTYNKIRKWTVVVRNTGSAMTLTQSAVFGDSITINENGIYSFNYADYSAAAGTYLGLSLNTTQPTTDLGSITGNEILVSAVTTAAEGAVQTCVAITIALQAGDVVRCHSSGNLTTTGAQAISSWTATKVSN